MGGQGGGVPRTAAVMPTLDGVVLQPESAEPATETKPLVKVSFFFNKRPDISDEEFHRYWSLEHAALLCSTQYFKQKIVKYNLYHNDQSSRDKATTMGLPAMKFDGAAEIWAEDFETLVGAMQDPEYLEKVVPDTEKFITRVGSQFFFGYDDLKIDHTK